MTASSLLMLRREGKSSSCASLSRSQTQVHTRRLSQGQLASNSGSRLTELELAPDDLYFPDKPREVSDVARRVRDGHVVDKLADAVVGEEFGAKDVGRRRVLLLALRLGLAGDREVSALVLVEDASKHAGPNQQRRGNREQTNATRGSERRTARGTSTYVGLSKWGKHSCETVPEMETSAAALRLACGLSLEARRASAHVAD